MKIDIADLLRSCAQARLFAEKFENHIPSNRMRQMAEGKEAPIGDDPRYVYKVGDIRFVYSLEEHPQKTGLNLLMRHVSISHPRMREEDNFRIYKEICSRLGFNKKNGAKSWAEDFGSGFAANFVQPVDQGEPLK